MGDKYEAFGRQTMTVLGNHADTVPASLNLRGAQTAMATLDALRPRLMQPRELVERGNDTEMALGADIMAVARFAKSRRTPEPETAE